MSGLQLVDKARVRITDGGLLALIFCLRENKSDLYIEKRLPVSIYLQGAFCLKSAPRIKAGRVFLFAERRR